jgi:prepilin-type N-terminal cleavage/methylation domain-containing protein
VVVRAFRAQRGFTLIEILGVVAILGILAAVAIAAYTKNIRSAHKAEVIADMANISLRQKTYFGVSGHYASSTNAEDPANTYPIGTAVSDPANGEILWNITDAEYTGSGLPDGAYTRGGGDVHGFDALRFMPEGARSYCGYATISGYGTNAADATEADEPPAATLADQVFPASADTDEYYARDWFYSYALCDFDKDGTFWAFTAAHYSSDVNYTTDSTNTYQEND